MAGESKYTALGVALGAAAGSAAGVLAGHVAIWLAIGVAIGVAIGASFRKRESNCPECAAVHQEHEARVKTAS